MRAARGGRGTPATLALTRAGIAFAVHAYVHDPAAASFGREAAAALGVDPDRVFKTLVASVDGDLTVAVVPVSAELDLKALATAAGGKRAELAASGVAERSTGYVRGGISPLGQRRALPTVVDTGLLDHDSVFVSGGRRGLEIELAPADLVRLTGASVAELARGVADR